MTRLIVIMPHERVIPFFPEEELVVDNALRNSDSYESASFECDEEPPHGRYEVPPYQSSQRQGGCY